MSGYFVKNPGSTLDYSFDWGFQLFDGDESIEADLGWTVHPDTAADGGLTVQSNTNTPTTTTAFLNGGVSGEAYLVCSRVRSTNGREIQRSLTIRVAHI